MIHSLIHTSDNNNLYIYDHQFRLSMLVHPEFKKAYEKSMDADPYYWGKYQYLENHGFFSKPKSTVFGNLNESMVEEQIMQTTQVTFEVTDSCNLNCSYCSFGELYEGFDVRNQKNINSRYAINLLKYIFDHQQKNKRKKLVIGFYGGEPLVNGNFVKQIVEAINQLKAEKELDIEYNMTTNATLLHKYIHFLAENNFKLLISLDGNEENHSYRFFKEKEENSFWKVIENIDMIQRDYPEYFADQVNFNAVLHNKNSVKEIFEFIYLRYHKVPRIAELSMDDMNPDKKDLHKKMFHSRIKSEAEYQKEASDLLPIMHDQLLIFKELTDFVKYFTINFYVANIIILLHKVEKYLPTNTCLPGQKKIMLTSSNKLLPCERVNYEYSIGEMNENVMMDIPEITRRYKFYYDHLKKTCQNCYANRFCGVCMFHIKKLDKVNTEEFVCEDFLNSEDFTKKAYRLFSFLEKYPTDFFKILETVIIT